MVKTVKPPEKKMRITVIKVTRNKKADKTRVIPLWGGEGAQELRRWIRQCQGHQGGNSCRKEGRQTALTQKGEDSSRVRQTTRSGTQLWKWGPTQLSRACPKKGHSPQTSPDRWVEEKEKMAKEHIIFSNVSCAPPDIPKLIFESLSSLKKR